MKEILIIPTKQDGVYLRELAQESDDAALFGLFEANREFWAPFAEDMLAMHGTLKDVVDSREMAELEGELRVGLWKNEQLLGWISIMDYSDDPAVGNWLGVWLDEHATGQGNATAAVEAVVEHIRSSRTNKDIATTTNPDNIAAIKLLERVGFTRRDNEELPYQPPGELVFKLPSSE
jgi:ribosomal-protein-alanine N-acetyltransferase